MMNNKKHLYYIDYLKAICIIMVVVLHSIVWGNKYYSIDSLIGDIISFICYYIGNPLFFIISGFLCCKQNVKKFYKKRFLNLIIPYWFFASIKLIYSLFINNEYAHTSDILSQLYDAFVMGGLYWFPYTLFIINIIFPLLWKNEDEGIVTNKPKKLIITMHIFILININLSFNIIELNSLTLPFQIINVIHFFPYFLFGYSIKYKKEEKIQFLLKNKKKSIIIMFLISLSIIIAKILDINIFNYVTYFVFCISSSLCLYYLSKKLPKNILILRNIGKYTWQIHFLDSYVKVILFGLVSKIININNLIIVITIALLNVVISMIFSMLLEKIPLIKNIVGFNP